MSLTICSKEYHLKCVGVRLFQCEIYHSFFNNQSDSCNCIELCVPFYWENLSYYHNGVKLEHIFIDGGKKALIYLDDKPLAGNQHRTIKETYEITRMPPSEKAFQFPERKKKHLNFQILLEGYPVRVYISGPDNFNLLIREILFRKDEIFVVPCSLDKIKERLDMVRVRHADKYFYSFGPDDTVSILTLRLIPAIRTSRTVWYIGGIIAGIIEILSSLFYPEPTKLIPLQASTIMFLAIIRGWLFTEHQNELPMDILLGLKNFYSHYCPLKDIIANMFNIHLVKFYNYAYLIIILFLVIVSLRTISWNYQDLIGDYNRLVFILTTNPSLEHYYDIPM